MCAVKSSGRVLGLATKELREDKDVVSLAVGSNAKALKFAMGDLKGDKELALTALNAQEGAEQVLEVVNKDLTANKELVKQAVGVKGQSLELAADYLKADKEVVLKAVSADGMALKASSEAMRDNKQVVLAAVRNCGLALEFASAACRDDPDVVRDACKAGGNGALSHASGRLAADADFVLSLISSCCVTLEAVADLHRQNRCGAAF